MITDAIFRSLPSPRFPSFNIDACYPTADSKKKDAREDCCMGDPEHATLKLGERGVRAWRRRVLRVRFRIPQPARPIVA